MGKQIFLSSFSSCCLDVDLFVGLESKRPECRMPPHRLQIAASLKVKLQCHVTRWNLCGAVLWPGFDYGTCFRARYVLTDTPFVGGFHRGKQQQFFSFLSPVPTAKPAVARHAGPRCG